jgi:hypothetical protein
VERATIDGKEAHMRRLVSIAMLLASIGALAVRAWRRNPRIGTRFVNAVVNPILVRRRLAGGGHSEIGTIEHVGRSSGIRRFTPIHPEPTKTGFRVLVPLGIKSEWARNVLAAGHCRIHLRDVVFDLDEPVMVAAGDREDLPSAVRRAMSTLGFQYLYLRTFAGQPDREDTAAEGVAIDERLVGAAAASAD